ncbi:hypothetical protein SDJN03_21056, partial [Cucurbita argyrosperma subsp. sororia]
MRLWRPNRCFSSLSKTLREPLFLFRSNDHSASHQFPSPILLHFSESHRFSTFSIVEDEKSGFRRPEMYRSDLAGTVAAYEEVQRSSRPTLDSDADMQPKLHSSAIKTHDKG